mmetsp:Transcript_51297/g.147268  ORF Transcript_51297/g.147268 Transcript_51297/m.147268 type:complete len:284 (-) Transcript_51297:671-1522(-)
MRPWRRSWMRLWRRHQRRPRPRRPRARHRRMQLGHGHASGRTRGGEVARRLGFTRTMWWSTARIPSDQAARPTICTRGTRKRARSRRPGHWAPARLTSRTTGSPATSRSLASALNRFHTPSATSTTIWMETSGSRSLLEALAGRPLLKFACASERHRRASKVLRCRRRRSRPSCAAARHSEICPMNNSLEVLGPSQVCRWRCFACCCIGPALEGWPLTNAGPRHFTMHLLPWMPTPQLPVWCHSCPLRAGRLVRVAREPARELVRAVARLTVRELVRTVLRHR